MRWRGPILALLAAAGLGFTWVYGDGWDRFRVGAMYWQGWLAGRQAAADDLQRGQAQVYLGGCGQTAWRVNVDQASGLIQHCACSDAVSPDCRGTADGYNGRVGPWLAEHGVPSSSLKTRLMGSSALAEVARQAQLLPVEAPPDLPAGVRLVGADRGEVALTVGPRTLEEGCSAPRLAFRPPADLFLTCSEGAFVAHLDVPTGLVLETVGKPPPRVPPMR